MSGEPGALSPEDAALLDRAAAWLAARRLAVPAVLFLESARPLTFLGSQALVFLDPMVRAVWGGKSTSRVAALLEERRNVEELVRRIEAAEARRHEERAGATGPPGGV